MNNLKVSIIIPVYNGSNYLKEAIDSALSQTYKNIEILVIDDGSSDGGATEKVAKTYGKQIKYYKKENGGVATALNFGIKKMTGAYFSWLSHDDMYYPEKVEKQMEQMNGSVDQIVISDWTIINKDGERIRSSVLDDRLIKYPGCFLAFDRKTWLNACAMLIPSKLFKDNGLFDESLKTTQDYDMLNRLVLAGTRFKITHQPLLYSRSHSEQGSLVESKAYENSDFIHSEIIGTLKYDDIIGYFSGVEEAIKYYDKILLLEFPRTAAFLMEKLVKGLIKSGKFETSNKVLTDNLSKLPKAAVMADENNFISKISKPSNRKKIMFCSAHWLTGGMERVLSILFEEIKDDYEIFLITPYDERISCIEIPKYVNSIKISDKLFFDHFDSLILSYALLFNINVVVGFVNLFKKQLGIYKLCEGTNIKTIASNHEYYLYPYKSPYHYGLVEKRLKAFAEADAVIWPTNFSAGLCGMYVNNSYVIANPNSFNIEEESFKNSSNKNIICVGRFNDYVKRVDRMLECFSLVLKKIPDAKLTLVGRYNNSQPIKPGGEVTVNDLLAKLNIPSQSIQFAGEVNNVESYYKNSNVLMMTSNSEGFGMVINEAACFGVPSVCNAIPGVEDLIIDGYNGYITSQDNIEEMSKRIIEVLSNDDVRNRLSKNAKKHVEKFESKHIGEQWKYTFNSVIKDNKDKIKLKRRLDEKIKFEIKDYRYFSNVVSKELNEIFLMSIKNVQISNLNSGLIYRIKDFKKRLYGSIENEGVVRTYKKFFKKAQKKIFKF